MHDLSSMTNSNILEQDRRNHRRSLPGFNPVEIFGDWFSRFMRRHVPEGYEDKNGFHYGMEPVTSESERSIRDQN